MRTFNGKTAGITLKINIANNPSHSFKLNIKIRVQWSVERIKKSKRPWKINLWLIINADSKNNQKNIRTFKYVKFEILS